MALLEISDVTMKFGSLIANRNITFNVEEGSIVGLIGPNGAGKTTLFNCISGYYTATTGKIVFDGKEITTLAANEIARLGAVRTFQVVHPLKEMSVLDNTLIGAFLRTSNLHKASAISMKCLEACHLGDMAARKAGTLTIGQKKRLEMARALATQPKMLMLDEAMAGLTSTEVKASVELIKSIRDQGVTLLVVEHIMEAIMPVADKVVVLDGGEKIAEGPPKEIVKQENVVTAYLGEKFAKRLKEAELR